MPRRSRASLPAAAALALHLIALVARPAAWSRDRSTDSQSLRPGFVSPAARGRPSVARDVGVAGSHRGQRRGAAASSAPLDLPRMPLTLTPEQQGVLLRSAPGMPRHKEVFISGLLWLALGLASVPLSSALFFALKGMLNVGFSSALLTPDLWVSIGSAFLADPFLRGKAWGALAVIAFGSLRQHMELAAWAGAVGGLGAAAVRAFGGKKAPRDLAARVARLGARAGLPPGSPETYVVPASEANAFAAGMSAKDSVVAVTQGLLDAGLTEEELDAVLAHEIGHIRNGDTGAGMRVAVMIAGFSSLLSFGLNMLDSASQDRKSSSSDDDDNGGALVCAGALIFAGGLVFALGTLLQKWVSRRHEFEADTAAVALTGSDALSRALAKIEAAGTGTGRTLAEKNPQFAHMYIASHQKSGFLGSLKGLFASHPRVEERQAAIDRIFARAGGRGEA
uniref:Peptidase M48 domain-containing protein n=1 Tax=Zooxanthella nutricula TaxID=1333877 RepID=A0A7S2VS58_9DINO